MSPLNNLETKSQQSFLRVKCPEHRSPTSVLSRQDVKVQRRTNEADTLGRAGCLRWSIGSTSWQQEINSWRWGPTCHCILLVIFHFAIGLACCLVSWLAMSTLFLRVTLFRFDLLDLLSVLPLKPHLLRLCQLLSILISFQSLNLCFLFHLFLAVVEVYDPLSSQVLVICFVAPFKPYPFSSCPVWYFPFHHIQSLCVLFFMF